MLICHITTVHKAQDVRIFYKECISLANAGHNVKLIVVEKSESKILKNFWWHSHNKIGVEIFTVKCSYQSVFKRFLKAGKLAYQKAFSIDADIYHFHDPEFLWFGFKLMKQGKKVIYDVHEDVPRQVQGKQWIPPLLKKPVAFLFEIFENYFAAKLTGIITVTDLLDERFKRINTNTVQVRNYPVLSSLPDLCVWNEKKNQLCYVGGITRERGIFEMIAALNNIDVKLALAGNFLQPDLRNKVITMPGWEKVDEYGFVNREQVVQILSESKVGLILLHPLINYQDALPVKLFEFMAAGIPVIVSDLRIQKQIVEEQQCGMVVNPFDKEMVQKAIRHLLENPDKAEKMGRNGRKAVEEKFNWNREEKILFNFYRSLGERN